MTEIVEIFMIHGQIARQLHIMERKSPFNSLLLVGVSTQGVLLGYCAYQQVHSRWIVWIFA